MSKITFTHISMKNGRIGVLLPGSYIRDNPRYFGTEAEAIEAVLDGNAGKHQLTIKFCDTCFNGPGKRATFSPDEFRRTCNERAKRHTPRKQERSPAGVAHP